MKLKYNFVVNNVAGSTVAVPVDNADRSFNGYVRLNETGAFIFKMLKNDVTVEEIVDACMNEYESESKEKVTETVTEFINNLSASGVLDNE